jgi:hypothetical protein
MAGETPIAGHTGTLSIYDGAAYKPVVCLTSSSHEMTVNLIERVTMCSGGKTEQSPQSISETVSIDGIIVDTTAVGGTSPGLTADELKAKARTQVTSKIADSFRLSRGSSGYVYFDAFISNISDSYPADGDATFSASLAIKGTSSSTDPKA